MNTRDATLAKVRDLSHFVGGKHVKGESGRFGDVFNPTSGALAARVPLASTAEAERAIANARQAFGGWSETSPVTRARVMFRYKELIERHMDELGLLIASEHGKVLSDAKGSIQRGLEVVEFACGIPHLMKGEYSDNITAGMDLYSIRQPLGVCAGITPFNFPAMVPMWMFPMAIACGNTFILKPSEKDPSCPLRLAELMLEAGAPPGVLNVVNGDKEAVDTLLTDPRVAAVSFVGSTPIAKYVFATGSVNGKRVQALGGAKNHMVVMPDADIDQAVDGLIGAGYGSAGERCMAISVAVPVGEETANRLVEKLIPKIESLRIGPYTDDKADMGPVVTKDAQNRIKGLISRGVEEGAKLLVGGGAPAQLPKGFYVEPTLFADVDPGSTLAQEEIFGPVLCVIPFDDDDDAVRIANDTIYGLSGAVHSASVERALGVARRIRSGTLSVNGDYEQTPAGTLEIQLASPTLFDKLNITGEAALAGAEIPLPHELAQA